MALKQLNQEEFRQVMKIGTVDAGTGSLFGVPQKREARKSGLTLVISTGGSGKSSILKALATANEKLDVDYSTYVKFLVVDSATDELAPLEKKGIDTLNLSSPGIVNRLDEKNRPISYRKFIAKDFPITSINGDGASQQRQIGRVKLFDANEGSTNDQLLYNKVASYFNGDWSAHKTLPIDIMILTGISGGNGSGTFLDIAPIVKAACPDPNLVTVYGYIMLPDTAERYASNDERKRIFYRNGYSALKELESFESLGMELSGRKEVVRTNGAPIELSGTNLPFNYPVLISGDYDEAVSMIAETIVDTIADSNGAFDQKSFYSNNDVVRGQRMSAGVVAQGGALKNGFCPEDSHMYCGIGYARASIPEKVVIPHVVGNIAKRLYVEDQTSIAVQGSAPASTGVFCTKNESLSKADFQKAMRQLLSLAPNEPLKGDSLWQHVLKKMNATCKTRENNVEITYNEVADSQINRYMAGFNVVGSVNNAQDAMTKFVDEQLKAIQTTAKNVMKAYGPRALNYLYEGVGNPGPDGKNEDYSDISMKTQLLKVEEGLIALQKQAGKMPAPLPPVGLIGRAVNALNNQRALTEWCADAKKAQDMNVRVQVAKTMAGTNGIWESKYAAPFKGFLESVSRFAEVLEAISDYYAGVGKSLDSDDFRDFAANSGETNGINLCTNASMYTWVKSRISDKLLNINLQNVKDALIDDFYVNTQIWTSNADGVARAQYDELMSKICGIGKYGAGNNGMNLTITDYFERVLEDVDDSNQQQMVTNTVTEIYTKLIAKSAPALRLKPGTATEINRTIILPKALESGTTGTMIKNAFSKLLANGTGNTQLAYSSVVDAMVCYQTSVANAISSLNDLQKWEDAYYAEAAGTMHRDNPELPSLHMNDGYAQYKELKLEETDLEAHNTKARVVYPFSEQGFAGAPAAEEIPMLYGTGLSWMNYPSLNTSRYENDFTSNAVKNPETNYRNDVFVKRVKEALRLGIIEWENEGNVYTCWMNVIPADWTNFNVKGYSTKKSGIYVRGKSIFEYLKKQNPSGSSVYRKQIALQVPSFFGPQGFDFSEIISLEHWTPERAEKTREAYMLRILRKSTGLYHDMMDTLYKFYQIESDLEKKEINALKSQAYVNFANFFLNGVIRTDEDKYEWNLMTSASGSLEEIVTFGRKYKMSMDALDKKLFMDNMKLYLVYRTYKDVIAENELKDSDLEEVQAGFIKKLSDKQFDQLLDTTLGMLEEETDAYKAVVGKAKDSLDAIMEHYDLDDEYADQMAELVDFYEACIEVIEQQKAMF